MNNKNNNRNKNKKQDKEEKENNNDDNYKKIGILDPEGLNLNPLNNIPYSEQYKELSKKWSNLPVYKQRFNIISSIKNNQITIITSSTGSGKSIITGLLALYTFNYEKKVLFSLPKQIITKTLSEYVAKMSDTEIGNYISYKYKGSLHLHNNNVKLLFATDGTIINMLLQNPLLSEYNVIIIDEAHERKVQVDFLLYLLKNALKKRNDLRIIIMSATINIEIFKNYFTDFTFNTIDVGGIRSFPIEKIYLNTPISVFEYVNKGYEIIKQIIKDYIEIPGDIIFFVPSVKEAYDICTRIREDMLDIYCIEVYSGMETDKEEIAIDIEKYKIYGKSRKLIIATGVAESSITINGIKFVIDSGYELYGYYDPLIGAKVLEKKKITQSQANQRAGRAGRSESGICYHLYTLTEFNELAKFPEPNIRVSNIYNECLKLLNYDNIKNIKNLLTVLSEFIEPPFEKYIDAALEELKDLNLINDKEITEFGQIIANLGMDPRIGIAGYMGKRLNCSNEVMLILSTTEVLKNNISDLFIIPNKKEEKENFENNKKELNNKYGDHLSIYKIMNQYRKINNNENKLNKFINKYKLNIKILDKVYKLYTKNKYILYKINLKNKIELKTYKMNEKILGCILVAYKKNIGYLHDHLYDTRHVNRIRIRKDSFINQSHSLPMEIVYNELFNNNGRLELNIVSKITSNIEEITNILQK